MTILESEEQKLFNILSAFEPSTKDRWPMGNKNRFRVDGAAYDKLRLLIYLLEHIKKFNVAFQPFEKTNWIAGFTYKKTHCTLTHEKFGFRLYVDPNLAETSAAKLSEEIIDTICHAVDAAEPAVVIYAKLALKAGTIIVNNKLRELENMYIFFRDCALTPTNTEIKHKEHQNLSKEDIEEQLWREVRQDRSPLYNEEAAYFAFFSLLEHICILFYAFEGINDKNITAFARKPWSEKFKEVFPVDSEDFSRRYEHLSKMSKYRRNPNAHGYVTNQHIETSFYFAEAKHRIPISLYDNEVILTRLDPELNLTELDSFLELIRTASETKNIMMYLDAGFDISFDSASLNNYKSIKTSSKNELEAIIDYLSHMQDDLANMDW